MRRNLHPMVYPQTSPVFWFLRRALMGHSFIKTRVGGAVLWRSPHHTHTATTDLEDQDNSTDGWFVLDPDIVSPTFLRRDWDLVGMSSRALAILSHSRASTLMIFKSAMLKIARPSVFVNRPKAIGQVTRWEAVALCSFRRR